MMDNKKILKTLKITGNEFEEKGDKFRIVFDSMATAWEIQVYNSKKCWVFFKYFELSIIVERFLCVHFIQWLRDNEYEINLLQHQGNNEAYVDSGGIITEGSFECFGGYDDITVLMDAIQKVGE